MSIKVDMLPEPPVKTFNAYLLLQITQTRDSVIDTIGQNVSESSIHDRNVNSLETEADLESCSPHKEELPPSCETETQELTPEASHESCGVITSVGDVTE